MSSPSTFRPALDPGRVVEDLRELHRLTGDADGAHRLCWTETWARARDWFAAKLDGLPVERHLDPAGNCWVTLPGELEEAVVVGSHLDSVPGGGWLDGALGVLTGLELIRAVVADGRPRRTLKVVDWADEEGSRFGYGMLGSSAVSGSLDVEHARTLKDRDGSPLPDVLREHGVDLDRALEAGTELEGAAAFLELHIEQGPVLERKGIPLGAVRGTFGVRRHIVTFNGQTAHAGSTPMADRRDSLAAAARALLAVRDEAIAAGGVATVGRAITRPGIPVAIAGETELIVDQRHLDPDVLGRMLATARSDAARIAEEEGATVRWDHLWDIDPIAFDPSVVEVVASAIADAGAPRHVMPSGPLHDAAEVARAGVPTAMMFVQSLGGLSHTKEEDTRPADVELAVRAMSLAVDRLLAA